MEFIEFVGFNKIPRLTRGCVVTEKIDGTNAQVFIPDDLSVVLAGSRNRWITIPLKWKSRSDTMRHRSNSMTRSCTALRSISSCLSATSGGAACGGRGLRLAARLAGGCWREQNIGGLRSSARDAAPSIR